MSVESVPIDETIGYTNDGMVFLAAMVKAPDGRPMSLMLSWEPRRALHVAELLTKAAHEVKPPSVLIGAYG